ncbi:MAG: hypothetical protein GY777_17515, partial [Candidatus Brocadiaceae bacterium]|nr:hypothetical protein [Candidatus Brocadiaceae bacterium]
MKIILYIHLFSALLFSFSVSANNTVESETLIPILLTKFYPPSVAGSDHAAEQSSLSKNIEIDLKNKGGYTFLDHPFEKYFYSKTFNNGVVEDNSEKYTAWNNAGLEYVATARLRNAKGGYKVEFQLLDVHEKKQIF